MPAYIPINPNSLLPGKPLTSPIALAWYENPIGIAEGAPGAPRVLGKALHGIRGVPISTTGTGYLTFTNLDDYIAVNLFFLYRQAFSIPIIYIQLSQDNGATWTANTIQVEIGNLNIPVWANIGLRDGYVLCFGTGSTISAKLPSGTYNAVRVSPNGGGTFDTILHTLEGEP